LTKTSSYRYAWNMNNTLPIDFKDERGRKVFKDVIKNLPVGVEVYLIAGSVRNAIDKYYHSNRKLFQRDYDQIVTKGSDKYLSYLKDLGFYEGRIQRPTQKVLIKSFVGNKDIRDFANNLVFDINLMDGTEAIDNLKKHVGLKLNGNAISIRDVFSSDWQDKLVSLPGALSSIKNKQLKLNTEGYKYQAANLFSVIRFVQNGYEPPSKEELTLLMRELPRVEDDRYLKNVQKVFDYVGGEDNARKICREIGIDIDIFDKKAVMKTVNQASN